MTTGIYKITNKKTGDCYIGASQNIEKRITQHERRIEKGIGNQLLGAAIRKYGWSNFEWDILQLCSPSELKTLEEKFIQQINPKYNTIVYKDGVGSANRIVKRRNFSTL